MKFGTRKPPSSLLNKSLLTHTGAGLFQTQNYFNTPTWSVHVAPSWKDSLFTEPFQGFSISQRCKMSVMCQQLAASPLFLERPTYVPAATRGCILVSSSAHLGKNEACKVSAMLAHRCWMCVFVRHHSWEGDITGQRLASTMSALWEVQQDSGSWQPRRGETKCAAVWFCPQCHRSVTRGLV